MKARASTGKSETHHPVIVGDVAWPRNSAPDSSTKGSLPPPSPFPVPRAPPHQPNYSAAHQDDLDQGVEIFARVGRELKIIP